MMDRIEHRLISAVHRADLAEDFSKLARDTFNYFYDNVVSLALDLGVTNGRALDLGTQFGMCALNLAKQTDYDFEITSFQDSVKGSGISREFAEGDMLESKIRWAVGKHEFMPFKDKTFDLVISGFDMHHWANPVRVLNEIERVMKLKGTLIIADFRRDAFSLMAPALKSASYVVKNDKLYDYMKASFNSSYKRREVAELVKTSDLDECEVTKDVQFVYVKKRSEKKKHVMVKISP